MAVTRSRFAILIASALVVDVILLWLQFAQVIGNLEAEVILGSWQFIGLGAWTKRRLDRHHDAVHERLAAQDRKLDETHARVGELHDFHIKGRLPDSELRPE